MEAHSRAVTAAGALAAAAIVVQVCYPLLDGTALTLATEASVLLFAGASLTHAGGLFGVRGVVVLFVGAAGVGLTAEAIGVHTGLPFGEYSYSGTLGPQVAGVPLVVPLAWTMMAYPCLLLARRLCQAARGGLRRGLVALTGGVTLAAWDLFLDPQMVQAGHWTWAWPQPHLPGVAGVPLTNYAGWLLVGAALTAVLDLLLPRDPRTDSAPESAPQPESASQYVPAALLAWTWLGSTLANVAFFDRPWVAFYGGLAMGATVLPYLLAVSGRAGRAGGVGRSGRLRAASGVDRPAPVRTGS